MHLSLLHHDSSQKYQNTNSCDGRRSCNAACNVSAKRRRENFAAGNTISNMKPGLFLHALRALSLLSCTLCAPCWSRSTPFVPTETLQPVAHPVFNEAGRPSDCVWRGSASKICKASTSFFNLATLAPAPNRRQRYFESVMIVVPSQV